LRHASSFTNFQTQPGCQQTPRRIREGRATYLYQPLESRTPTPFLVCKVCDLNTFAPGVLQHQSTANINGFECRSGHSSIFGRPAIRSERASITPSNPVALSREPHQPLPPALPLVLGSLFADRQVARPPPQRPRSGFGPRCPVGRVLLGSTCLDVVTTAAAR
jgi:hypothetical protein